MDNQIAGGKYCLTVQAQILAESHDESCWKSGKVMTSKREAFTAHCRSGSDDCV
jgi:hypothetical protein